MKRLLVLVVATALLAGACSGSDGKKTDKKTDLSNAKPGDKVTLSETLQFDTVPNAVIPYATQPALEFSNLQLTPDGDYVSGKADFVRSGQDEFALVAVLSLKNEILFEYFSPDINLTLHLPSGTVLFGTQGYEMTGTDQGTIQFSVSGRIYSGYNIFEPDVTAYLFAVPGQVYSNSVLPGDQTVTDAFLANSNVLKMQVDLSSGS
jgi:hypothetical protein